MFDKKMKRFDDSQDSFVALRNVVSERTNRLTVWGGAGLSADAKLPGWYGLREKLVVAMDKKMASISDADIEKTRRYIQRCRTEKDLWLAFELIVKKLGNASYRSVIRDSLKASDNLEAPVVYEKIWSLPISGFLNLNLDKFATKAFIDRFPKKSLTEFSGIHASSHVHLLKSPPFIANLHGVLQDADSWVFTRTEMQNLLGDAGYKALITGCISSTTLVFVGITADDVAAGGHLENLKAQGIDAGTHFWITHRRDSKTDRWAEKSNIRVIRYDADDGNHVGLSQILDALIAYVPEENSEPQKPVVLSHRHVSPEELGTPKELAQLDAETIRQVLNAHARTILKGDSPAEYEEYAEFCTKYRQAIYRAWYTSTLPDENILLDYQLREVIGQGAFGKVYRATSPQGDDVAVKVLLEHIRDTPALLQGFRRGVRSMEILKDRKVEGMVAYKEASEIPAFAVMDWVEGPNLSNAVAARAIDDWESILRVGVGISDILRRAHMLPERVLHRDLRPPNIMLRNFYTEPDDWDVVILDFDLSWHRGSFEQSIMHNSSTAGYLAPEQIERIPNASTRHAGVDSFGFGMTMFYVISGSEPLPAQHRHSDWKEVVRGSAMSRQCSQWRSIPRRFARTLLNATRDKQSERWDMSQIQGELSSLYEAYINPTQVQSAELVAEEMASLSEISNRYDWNGDRKTATLESATGTSVHIVGDESNSRIQVSIAWTSKGDQDHKRIASKIKDNTDDASAELRKNGWQTKAHYDYMSMQIVAYKNVNQIVQSLAENSQQLNRAARRIGVYLG